MTHHDGNSSWRHGHRKHHKAMNSGSKGKGLDKKLRAQKRKRGK